MSTKIGIQRAILNFNTGFLVYKDWNPRAILHFNTGFLIYKHINLKHSYMVFSKVMSYKSYVFPSYLCQKCKVNWLKVSTERSSTILSGFFFYLEICAKPIKYSILRYCVQFIWRKVYQSNLSTSIVYQRRIHSSRYLIHIRIQYRSGIRMGLSPANDNNLLIFQQTSLWLPCLDSSED